MRRQRQRGSELLSMLALSEAVNIEVGCDEWNCWWIYERLSVVLLPFNCHVISMNRGGLVMNLGIR